MTECPKSTLPESFVRAGLEIASGATVMGKKFSDMTRDELIAVAAHGWASEARARQESSRQLDFMRLLTRKGGPIA